MFFHIDPHNGLAIYDQIVRQVKFAVAGGVLKSGELVPSVRELARELAINPNTIARAFRQLQDDRVLEPVRGTGMEVATGAGERCRNERLKLIRATNPTSPRRSEAEQIGCPRTARTGRERTFRDRIKNQNNDGDTETRERISRK